MKKETHTVRIQLRKTCRVCEDYVKAKGLHVNHSFICHSCEKNLVITSPSRSEYNRYIEAIKKIWSVHLG